MCNLAWPENFERGGQWRESVEKVLRLVICFCVCPYQLCKPAPPPPSLPPRAGTNIEHQPYRMALRKKSCASVSVAFDPISNPSSTDSEVWQKWEDLVWEGGRLDSQSTLTLAVSLGWRAGQKQERMDGIAWHVSIQKVFGRTMLEEKKGKLFIGLVPTVFLWNVIITQSWMYLLHIQATCWSYGSLLFINI